MSAMSIFYEKQAETVIKALQKRGMDGYYCPDSKSAVEKVLSLIPEGATVTWGGSESITECGLLDALKNAPVELWDRAEIPQEERKAFYRKAFSADFYLMSANAVTLDGQLVNIDGTGNRVAALSYGPDCVILLVGMNKIVPHLMPLSRAYIILPRRQMPSGSVFPLPARRTASVTTASPRRRYAICCMYSTTTVFRDASGSSWSENPRILKVLCTTKCPDSGNAVPEQIECPGITAFSNRFKTNRFAKERSSHGIHERLQMQMPDGRFRSHTYRHI